METKRLQNIIKKVEELPTLPIIFNEVSELVDRPNTSASDLGRVITRDQALAGKLLKIVNSAFYGFPQQITTITRAITIIGFDALKNLVLSTSVIHMFKDGLRRRNFNQELFWKHSIGCALGAKIIGKFTRMENLEELFVGGLLHDIGKLVHSLFMRSDFDNALEMVTTKNILLLMAEQEVLRFNHADTGGLLMQRWRLPEKIIYMVKNHHSPQLTYTYHKEIAVIHLADILCRAKDLGSGGDERVPPLDLESWKRLSLTTLDLENIMEKMGEEFEEVCSFMIGGP